MSKDITISQCRNLREMINAYTQGCLLTEEEYVAIITVLANAAKRLEREGKVRYE